MAITSIAIFVVRKWTLSNLRLAQWMERKRRERIVVGHVLSLHGASPNLRTSSFGSASARCSTSWSENLDAHPAPRCMHCKPAVISTRLINGMNLESNVESAIRVE